MNKLTLAVLAMLALPAMAGTSKPKGASMSDSSREVRQQVRVEAKGGKVMVTLALENAGARPVYAPKAVYVDDEIFRREFEIVNQASGAQLDYIGPMVKRGPFTREDFVAVKPGAKIAHSIDITRSYDFKPGTTYQLTYAGAYLADLARLDAPAAARPPAVTFTFSGK